MALFPISKESQAYVDGFKNGCTDRRIGIKSEYAWNCANDLNEYASNYSRGYRRGLLAVGVLNK
jgi:hypothetical protein